MKKLFTAVCAALALVGTAFAATPTTEPQLPMDIDTAWSKKVFTCKEVNGKVPGHTFYTRRTDELFEIIQITTVNGKKVAWAERSLRRGAQNPEGIYYVKYAVGGAWMKYADSEVENALDAVVIETGLMPRQLRNCTAE